MPNIPVESGNSEIVRKLKPSEYRHNMQGFPKFTYKEADAMMSHMMDKALKRRMKMSLTPGWSFHVG